MSTEYTSFYNMESIKRFNHAAGQHFFEADTMRFFKSRIAPGVYHKGDHINLFITSEKFDYKTPRFYTIRQLQPNGSIKTIGEFQQYKSLDSACRAIKSGRAFVEAAPTE